MFKNYFQLGWRNLLKNKLSTIINIGGLSIGLATGIIIMLWITDEFGFNAFHAHLQDIHLLMQHQKRDGTFFTGSSTPAPLAAALRSDLPEIKYAARSSYGGQQLIKTGDKNIYQLSLYADPDYFNIMTFPAIAGNPVTALREPGSVVLTESAAARLFGKADPMGKIIRQNNTHDLKVAAIIRDIPPNSTMRCDIILPFRLFEQENKDWIDKWDNNRLLTWVQLQPGADLPGLNHKLEKLFLEKTQDSTEHLFAYPFADSWMHGAFKNGKPNRYGGRFQVVMLSGIIGLFVLLIACINFMNLATARSERRAREVGVRKALGASRKTIIFQFLAEALLITFLAMLLSILLTLITIPALNRISGRSISFGFSNWRIWSGLLSLVLFTGLVAGSYPAFFLSSFQPVKVLKGVISHHKGGSILRRSLVTFQFVLSIIMIITTIVIYNQLRYGQNRPVGYNQDNLLEIPARGDMTGKFKVLKNDLLQIPEIVSVSAGTDNLLEYGGATDGIQWPGKTPDQNFSIVVSSIQYDWARTAGMTMVAGREFSPDYGSDSTGCIVNQTAVKKMGLKEPIIGTLLGKNPIIGVVKDFVCDNPFNGTRPMAFYLGTGAMNHFFIRLRDGVDPQQSLVKIEQAVKRSNPEYPFEYYFNKEAYQKQFDGIRSGQLMINWIGGMAILISCLGLFGLSAFLAERRNKEIGIRKIMGANAVRIWFMLTQDFLKPVIIAFLLAAPLALIIMQQLLHGIEYRIELQWWMFLSAGALAVIIAVATVSYQGVRAARANPVKALQAE
ncbi:FtsX-like permease family protein [Chitinophaga niastensis]|uniref:FtsX-like permease family protein n=1 Tax=Chitinophaga niastensis TaxID=536980 RepID=A0A2P8HQ78_CHINA|nr:ABC transporter permease [Chitinophaga niastensis]PSL48369.1 FtsX-like permease family protein [Chitinophaga niastensis]